MVTFVSPPCDSHLPRWGPPAFANLICPGGGLTNSWGSMLTSSSDGIYPCVGWHVIFGIHLCVGWHLPLCGLMITAPSDGIWQRIAWRLHVAFGSDLTSPSDGIWM